MDSEQTLRDAIKGAGWTLRVFNNGEHWRLRFDGLEVEWWPSSGRVVFDRKYSRPRKAHDHEQLWRLVERRSSGARDG